MIFGQPFGAGFGNPQNMLSGRTDVELANSNTAIRVRIAPATSFGGAYFGVYVNSKLAGTQYVEEGEESPWITYPRRSSDTQSVLILRNGQNSFYDQGRVCRKGYEEIASTKVTCSWDWSDGLDIIDTVIDSDGENNGDLSSWSLSGLVYSKLDAGPSITRRRLTVDMETDGGTTTVTLSRGGVSVASGTCTAPATCTLAEVDSSGISGSVDVGASPTDVEGSILYIRFPKSINILREDVDPPTATVATIDFNGQDSGTWTEEDDLATDTYYYRFYYVSDTGDDGTESASTSVTVPGPSDPPTNLAYSSGNAAATILSYTEPTPAALGYTLYWQPIGGEYINLSDSAASSSGGMTTVTLPAITGYPGKVYVILRAFANFIHEQNADVLELEYDASGNYVTPRPNQPAIGSVEVDAGTSITVSGQYDTTDEAATATQLQLFTRVPNGSYNFSSPQDTASLGATFDPNIKAANLSANLIITGFVYLCVKSATAAGIQSETRSDEFLVYLDSGNLSAPEVSTTISRG